METRIALSQHNVVVVDEIPINHDDWVNRSGVIQDKLKLGNEIKQIIKIGESTLTLPTFKANTVPPLFLAYYTATPLSMPSKWYVAIEKGIDFKTAALIAARKIYLHGLLVQDSFEPVPEFVPVPEAVEVEPKPEPAEVEVEVEPKPEPKPEPVPEPTTEPKLDLPGMPITALGGDIFSEMGGPPTPPAEPAPAPAVSKVEVKPAPKAESATKAPKPEIQNPFDTLVGEFDFDRSVLDL